VTEETPPERRMKEALGPELGSDAVVAAGEVAKTPSSMRRPLLLATIAVLALVVVGFLVAPPYPPGGQPGQPITFPRDAIIANFEPIAPHVIIDLDPSTPPAQGILAFDPTIPSSILTGWLVMAVIVVLAVLMSRGVELMPSRAQNMFEYVYEGLANFATSLGGPPARRYVPIFAAFFLFILFGNWSGLLPFVGKVEFLRAPTSDLNVTIGLALVSFALFHIEGVRSLGFRGYIGKFFSLRPFREDGLGAGLIALFVGLMEFMLEFVKPVTLAMRLFGNIYGGEVALGVITALTIAVVPVAIFSLEVLLNFMQALIFSVLTLMFTLIAIEGHDEGHAEEHADRSAGLTEELPKGNVAPAHG
jgi:F-type H+-transporting ATPase subunit a